MSRKLLWVGDVVASTGSARVSHAALAALAPSFDISVIGINFQGDPDHGHPFKIYPAARANRAEDPYGVKRLGELYQTIAPDVVVIVSDSWNMPVYTRMLPEGAPVVGWVGVDGLNVVGEGLRGLTRAVFWSEFGREQARLGGYDGPSGVVGLGVDTKVFSPMNRGDARDGFGWPDALDDAFVFGVVERNQWRKRLDLTLAGFSLWLRSKHDAKDAYLFIHAAPPPRGDGFDLKQLAIYNGLEGRVLLSQPTADAPPDDAMMRKIYCAMDALIATPAGEGFGLTVLEAMACGVPTAVPAFGALAEWTSDASLKMLVGDPVAGTGGPSSVWKPPTVEAVADAFDALYADKKLRTEFRSRGLFLATRPHMSWTSVGERFAAEVDYAVPMPSEAAPEPVGAAIASWSGV